MSTSLQNGTAPLPSAPDPAGTVAIAIGEQRPLRPRSVVRQVLTSWRGALVLGFLVLMIVLSFAAPWVSPYDPVQNDLAHVLELPGLAHPLGTDQLGRDVLSRLLWGGQLTFIGVAQAVIVAFVVGVPIGILAGYAGGWVDAITSRIVEIMLALPAIVILLMIFAIYGSNQTAAMITLGLLYTPGLIRIVRSATIAVREELYVSAARVSGLRAPQIMVRHILPRVSGPIIVNASLTSAAALLVQTGLSFLGLGVQLPHPSWGGMVAEAGTVLRQQPWLIIPSGLAITLTVLCLVLLGDTIRDATQAVRSTTTSRLSGLPRRRQHLSDARSDAVGRIDGPSALVVEDLSIELPLRDGWTTVVDRVSFSVGPGETLGLVGESGCGKTVTAMALFGLVQGGGRVSNGSVTLNGERISDLGERGLRALRGKRIGYISQEPMSSLDPAYTVGNQLVEAIRQHARIGRGAARRRAIELLSQTGIPDPEGMARKYPHQISGGMAQRVVIARALAGDPEVLVADEPTTALDSTVQREILALLQRIQLETNMAVILVSHDWGVIAETCDRAVVMYAGQVVEQGPVSELFHATAHPYTHALLRANPHLAAEGERLISLEGAVPAPASWPAGCRFAARCPIARSACREESIPLIPAAPGHVSRCIRIDAVGEEE